MRTDGVVRKPARQRQSNGFTSWPLPMASVTSALRPSATPSPWIAAATRCEWLNPGPRSTLTGVTGRVDPRAPVDHQDVVQQRVLVEIRGTSERSLGSDDAGLQTGKIVSVMNRTTWKPGQSPSP